MGNISKHFSRYEFACSCGCQFQTVDSELLQVLEQVREHFEKPVHINSGCRCLEHNTKIGGSKDSKHMQGIAADIVVEEIEPDVVADYLEERFQERYGIGRYTTFTHIDVRPNKARWNQR